MMLRIVANFSQIKKRFPDGFETVLTIFVQVIHFNLHIFVSTTGLLFSLDIHMDYVVLCKNRRNYVTLCFESADYVILCF